MQQRLLLQLNRHSEPLLRFLIPSRIKVCVAQHEVCPAGRQTVADTLGKADSFQKVLLRFLKKPLAVGRRAEETICIYLGVNVAALFGHT